MANGLVTSRAFKSSRNGKDNRGSLCGCNVTIAGNGYSLSCNYDPKDRSGPWPEGETLVFTDRQELLDQIESLLPEYKAKKGKG